MKPILLIIIGLALTTTVGCYSPTIHPDQYSGNGKIQTFEAWGRGVRVDFEPVSLSQSFTKTYRIQNLPVIFQPYNLYLVIDSRKTVRWPRPNAHIIIELSNKDGDIYYKTSTKFSDWTWTNGKGGNAFYLSKQNVPRHELSPSPNSEYFLKISYSLEEPVYISDPAFFRLTAGGIK